MRIAICEDVKSDQKALLDLLSGTKLLEGAQYFFFDNGLALLQSYKAKEKYDIIFLDVDMPMCDGIDAGKRISKVDKDVIIIFVTSYPDFAIDAYDCNAFHYLLKGCSYDKVYEVVYKAVERYKEGHRQIVARAMIGMVNINVADINYVECYKRHVLYHTNQKIYDTLGTLQDAMDKLRPHGFYQTHQGYIVNFNKVREFEKNDVILKNGEKVMMSIRKRIEVMQAYAEYIRKVI